MNEGESRRYARRVGIGQLSSSINPSMKRQYTAGLRANAGDDNSSQCDNALTHYERETAGVSLDGPRVAVKRYFQRP